MCTQGAADEEAINNAVLSRNCARDLLVPLTLSKRAATRGDRSKRGKFNRAVRSSASCARENAE